MNTPFYCAKAGKRVLDEAECGALAACPKERGKCEIYRAHESRQEQNAAAQFGPDPGAATGKKNKGAERETAETKTCSACGLEKPVSEFYRKKKNPDGLEYACKPCVIARQKQYDAKKRKQGQAGKMKKQAAAPDPGSGNPDPVKENGLKIVLDFSGHKELFERLSEAAQEDLRSLDMEVLYLVKKVFERADGKAQDWQISLEGGSHDCDERTG